MCDFQTYGERKKKKWPREELVTRLAGKKEEKEKQTKIMINRKLK